MKKRVAKIIALFSALAILACTCGCTLNAYTVDELRQLYPKAVENSLKADLFFWKETANPTGGDNTFRRCNVYAEIDKKYEPIRNENGDYANMDVEIIEQVKGKDVLKIWCGDSPSASGGEKKNYFFKNTYVNGKVDTQTKTPLSAKEYVNSEEFQNKYSLDIMLAELEHLTVDDMEFGFDKSEMTHKGNVVQVTFSVKDSYLERYKEETGKDSIFAGSFYVSLEMVYERVSSLIIYVNETLDQGISLETERYKLEITYFGPIVAMPKYDETAEGKEVWKEV